MTAAVDIRATTNMTSKGQVLIPKDVRDAIGLVPGQPVKVGIDDRGRAVILPAGPAARESPEDRLLRIERALATARARHGIRGTTEEIMRELRGDDPWP